MNYSNKDHSEVVTGSADLKQPVIGDTREFEYIESEIICEDDTPAEDALLRFQSTIKEEINFDPKEKEEIDNYLTY